MKIGFDAKRLFHNTTGLGNYSRDLVRILQEHYPDNSYFLYNPKQKEIPYFSDPEKSFKIVSPHGIWKKAHPLWRSFGISFTSSIKQLDIYHGLSGELPINLPTALKKVVTIHDLIFMRYPNLYSSFDRKMHFAKFKYAVKNADAVVAISEQTKRDIVQFLGIKPEKIHVIYQGCSAVFKNTYSEQELFETKNKFALPDQFILNVGTIEARKNALSLVKAIKNIDTTLVFVGRKTKYTLQIEQYIQKHRLEYKVIFLTGVTLNELAHIYQLSTVFVYPSIFEGFGIPIIEALYSGTPVIASCSGVFPEAGGPDSIYVDEKNADEIALRISELLSSPELRMDMNKKGKEYATKFNDSVIAKAWHDLYTELSH